MYPVKAPVWVKWLPCFFWPKPVSAHGVFITFDDGPHPETTPAILRILDEHGAKATFFLLGENALKYPALVTSIRESGHTIGNHGFCHLDGWETENRFYREQADKAAPLTSDHLFRPPYGRISPLQLWSARRAGYQVVLWDIMPGDFDEQISADVCLQRISTHCREGSIIVLHENEKSKDKVLQLLEATLTLLKARNFAAEKIIF